MNLERFKPGDVLHLHDGSRAEVLAPSKDGRWIKVRYAETPDDPDLVGTEDLTADHEVAAFTPAAPGPEWSEKVTAVLHRVPETEDFEGGFEAVTITGVLHNVMITGSDPETAGGALEHLLAGLRAFGFSGTLAVDDATYIGGVNRYEIIVE